MKPYRFPEITQMNVAAARQAIVGADGRLLGYELLWRNHAAEQSATVLDDYDATMRALFAVGLNLGWKRFFESTLAFVNVDLEFIEKHLYTALPPHGCVLELRPFRALQGQQRFELIQARRLGYEFAWDAVCSVTDERLSLAQEGDYVKIDVQAAVPGQVILLLDLCADRKLRPIVYKVEHDEEREFLVARGAYAAQGHAVHRTESRAHVQLLAPPVEALHAFRHLLLDGSPMLARVQAVEDCPEMLLALLMLTDVVWRPQWPYPNTVEQLLRGMSREGIAAWLDIMLYQLYREPSSRRRAAALAMLKPAVFARMVSSKLCPGEVELHHESFLSGFVAHLLCIHPHLIEAQQAPVHLGHTLQRAIAPGQSPSNLLINHVWNLSRADALGQLPELSPELRALAEASKLIALESLESASGNSKARRIGRGSASARAIVNQQ
jgi:hypothetical protein